MRFAIFSDVHGNIHALDAVLADIDRQSPARTYCLGDLVGYGAFPNEVVDRIRQRNIATIAGNYDDGVGFDRDDCGCAYKEEADKERGQASLEWTKAHTTADGKAFLKALPSQIRLEADGQRLLLVHGSPRKINEYLFEDRPLSSFERLARSSDADAIAFGHTHVPYLKTAADVLFVNVGSVGRPKDGDPRACYAVIDFTAAAPVTFRRIAYDVTSAAAAIRATDLPHTFARDLELGGRLPPTLPPSPRRPPSRHRPA